MDSTKKSIDIKSSKLSATVMDYYSKYGQNRDLEKYLRLRRHSTSKSSSDSSLLMFESSNPPPQNQRIVKSMETLQIDDEKVANISDTIDKSISEPENKTENRKKVSNDGPPITQQKKSSRHERRKSKNKSYNLSLESNVEINLPTLGTSMPSISIVAEPPVAPVKMNKCVPESVETQTSQLPLKQVESKATGTDELELSQEKFTTAIAPCTESPRNAANKSLLIADISPTSSVASAKYRLEWDSMADIGYNKIIDFKSKSNRNLTTFERNALTKLFAEHGVNFDESLVIMASSEKRSPLVRRSFTQSAIEMHDAKKIGNKKSKMQSHRMHSWQKAIEKYRDKYGKRNSADLELTQVANSEIDSTQFMSLSTPDHHSTPVADNMPQSVINDIKLNVPHKNDKAEEKTKMEKSCQTISKDMETIGVQVEKPVDVASAAIQTEYCDTFEKSQVFEADLTSATSFEFIAPSAYKNANAESDQSCSENVLKLEETTEKSLHLPDNESSDESQYGKENVPPVEDKENVPPPKNQSIHYTNQFSGNEPCCSRQLGPTVNEANMSTLPVDLQKGVDLINILMESRKMNREAKKKCIRKIVRYLLESDNTHDISQMLLSFSDKSRSNKTLSNYSVHSDTSAFVRDTKPQMSGVSSLSSTSSSIKGSILMDMSNNRNNRTAHETAQEKEVAQPITVRETAEEKEWLKPITQSELEKEWARRSRNVSHSEEMKGKRRFHSNDEIFEILKHEKETHYNWIDQEIQHLSNLKTLLQNVQSDEPNECNKSLHSLNASQENDFLVIYENARHNRNKINNQSQADASSAIHDSSSSCEHSKMQRCLSDKTSWVHKSGHQASNSSDSTVDRNSITSKNKTKQNLYDVIADDSLERISKSNMQTKNRTKLDTPPSTESVESFARHRREQFDQIRTKAQTSAIVKDTKATRTRPIYTKPYSTDLYPEIENLKHSSGERKKQLRNVEAYISGSGIDDFLSSNSMSIPVPENSTSNTTTHQYDSKISVGSQTTDTLQRLRPMQVKHAIPPIVEEPEPEPESTVRVNKLTINKQSQVRPDALAYVIMFEENFDRNGNSKRCATERGNKLYAENDRLEDSRGHSSCSDSKGLSRTTQHLTNDGFSRAISVERSSSKSSSTLSVEHFTLQEYLRLRRPDFYASAEQRRICVQHLHDLRQQRNEQRKDLFASATCGNARSLNSNMKRLLPPPPLTQMRIFSSREIIQKTRQKYQELPEMRHRQQVERDRKIRRNQRIMMGIFNKNLQKNALRGKINMSNSMTVVN